MDASACLRVLAAMEADWGPQAVVLLDELLGAPIVDP